MGRVRAGLAVVGSAAGGAEVVDCVQVEAGGAGGRALAEEGDVVVLVLAAAAGVERRVLAGRAGLQAGRAGPGRVVGVGARRAALRRDAERALEVAAGAAGEAGRAERVEAGLAAEARRAELRGGVLVEALRTGLRADGARDVEEVVRSEARLALARGRARTLRADGVARLALVARRVPVVAVPAGRRARVPAVLQEEPARTGRAVRRRLAARRAPDADLADRVSDQPRRARDREGERVR